MTHTTTAQAATLFPAADAEYMSDRLRAAGIVSLTDPEVDTITVNRIRVTAEEIKATCADWTPTWGMRCDKRPATCDTRPGTDPECYYHN